jgi:hypothetical protein
MIGMFALVLQLAGTLVPPAAVVEEIGGSVAGVQFMD